MQTSIVSVQKSHRMGISMQFIYCTKQTFQNYSGDDDDDDIL